MECDSSPSSIAESSISVPSVPLEDGAIGDGSGTSDGLEAGYGDVGAGGCSFSEALKSSQLKCLTARFGAHLTSESFLEI